MAAQPFIAPASISIDGMTIRGYQPGDGPELRIATVSSYEHLRPWMPWATTEYTLEEAEARCRRLAASYLLNEDFTLGVWIGEELVGGTGFHLREGPLEWRNAEIGMWIRANYAGQGLGTRVLKAMLKWGFETWGWERLSWRCDTRNIASARLAQKNGLQLEGTLRSNTFGVAGERRDTYVFAILRPEWEQRHR
jgi:RimJ/RimL family protein N-acetyltransferase